MYKMSKIKIYTLKIMKYKGFVFALISLFPILLVWFLKYSQNFIIFYFGFIIGFIFNFFSNKMFQKNNFLNKILYQIKNNKQNVYEIYDLIRKYAPDWAINPDLNQCHWINHCLEICWPTISYYVTALLMETITQNIENVLSKTIGKTHVKKLILGNKPPTIDGINVITQNIDNHKLIIDISCSYFGNSAIELDFNHLPIGIKEIFLKLISKQF